MDANEHASDAPPHGHGGGPDPFAGFPPIIPACDASMALIIAAGIYIGAHLPAHPALGPAVGLLAASGALLLVAAGMVARLKDFAWDTFFTVFKWAGLAWLGIAGILEYIFIYDGTRGSLLAVLTLSLVVFAGNIPLLLAFAVARFQKRQPAPTA